MATQGLIGITKNGKTQLKLIAGSDGYNVPAMSKWIKSNPNATNEDIWEQAKKMFGKHSLVMQLSPSEVICDNEWAKPRLDSECLYRTMFEKPDFNPRWKLGTAEYFETFEIPSLHNY